MECHTAKSRTYWMDVPDIVVVSGVPIAFKGGLDRLNLLFVNQAYKQVHGKSTLTSSSYLFSYGNIAT